MDIYRKRFFLKLLLLLFAVAIGFGSLLYTQSLVKLLKNEEKKKAALWAEATRQLVNVSLESGDFDFLFSVIEGNNTVPVILTDDNEHIISTRNLTTAIEGDSTAMRRELNRMKERNEPIMIDIGDGSHNYIYYRESVILRKLVLYPFIQLGVVLLFISIAYMAFSASRIAEQNQVWVGLSKETAHQLGTPVSSLSAWLELFENRYPEITEINDISADVERLSGIAERFSLIGSKPKLKLSDVRMVVINVITYFRKRLPSTIDFQFDEDSNAELNAYVNVILFGWVIENLIKNSVDAMQGTGVIRIIMRKEYGNVVIDIEDNGRGIPKKDYKNIFKPGFSTRERGWGLGLSLSKRIIEEYHNGRIYVRSSEPGKGTTMRVILKK